WNMSATVANRWILAGLALCSVIGVVPLAWAQNPASSVSAAAPLGAVVRSLPDFTDLVEQVGPSVVNIRTVERVTPRNTAQSQTSQNPSICNRCTHIPPLNKCVATIPQPFRMRTPHAENPPTL
ncbi:MAG: hypothetical protein EB072_19590, partial [Betaproteobacteria bacterium]|nr:hypothetical protein [Betaproteobacteria bacterium]